MPRLFVVLVVAASLGALASSGACQPIVLTLDMALARARDHAPEILSARAAIGEARGRLLGASALLRDNPSLTTTLGRRRKPDAILEDRVFGISQSVELGGRRGARMSSARADVERVTAESDDVARSVLRGVGHAFLAALAAKERLALATADDRSASHLHRPA